MTDLLRQEVATAADMLVVKVGTRVLTNEEGRLDNGQIARLAEQLHYVISTGRRVCLVSSGAVGSGMGRLGLKSRPCDLPHLQAVAAVGQSMLVEVYERCLWDYGHHAAQILLTAEDLDHRTRYLNVRNTLLTLMDLGAVPIVNENDSVSVEELQTTFGDNDRLAALVANLVHAPLLVLLSDVEGLYTAHPSDPQSRMIPTVEKIDESILEMVRDRTGGLSKGGMGSKLNAARIATAAGGNVIIGSGRRSQVLRDILAGEPVGTLFFAQGQTIAARKRWIGFTVRPRGYLVLDAGACCAVQRNGRSLLPIGVIDVVGRFHKGDVVGLRNAAGREIARGLTNYSAEDVRRIQGMKTGQIATVLGQCPYDELIHRDNLLVLHRD